MKRLLLIAALSALASGAFAQSNQDPKDESAPQSSAQSIPPSVPASSDSGRSSAGATADSSKTFTHGESMRCESLTGAGKEQCDKEEATKAQGAAVEDQ